MKGFMVLGSRIRGLLLAIPAGLLPWLCWLTTANYRSLDGQLGFTDYLITGAAWLLVACSGWATMPVVAVLVEELSEHRVAPTKLRFPLTTCPPALRRFVLIWCGLAITTSLGSAATADSPGSHLDPPPTLGRVLDQPKPVLTPGPAKVTVRPGDSLWALAKSHLGSGQRWPEILQLNRDQIKDPDLIEPGWRLRLPPPPGPLHPNHRKATK